MSIFRKRPVHTLPDWLEIATRKLAHASKERIRVEIEAHYAEAKEAHRENGLSEADAQTKALAQLGDAKLAARRFRKQHLTEREANRLKQAHETARNFLFPLLTYALFCVLTSGYVRQILFRHLQHLLFFFALQFVFLILVPTVCFVVARRSNAKPNRNLLWLEALYYLQPAMFPYLWVSSTDSYSPSVGLYVVCTTVAILPYLPFFLIRLHLWRKVKRLEKISTHTPPPAPAQM